MISVIKKLFIAVIILLSTHQLDAQNTFEQQFEFAKNLFDDEKYFDAVTEFKRLLFFEESNSYNFEANLFIGLSYKFGAKYSDAVRYFILAEINSTTDDELFIARVELIKVNMLRRTTHRAFTLLDSLAADKKFINKMDEINYWRGWAYIFSDDWESASQAFSEIDADHQLVMFCDSLANEMYSPSLAKALSIIPGAGQFYTGEYISGLISISWNVLWGYLTINAFIEERVFGGFVVGTLLWWRFYSGNLQNAEKFAFEKNLENTNSALRYLQFNFNGVKP
jgi:TM2 domain-containing membrane protein YozV